LLEGTGCRLAEITGLLASDVILDHPIPYLKIQQHSHRRLKTKGAARTIPLVGGALAAAKDAIKDCEATSPLLARYAVPRGSDRASAALMKRVRAVVRDPKVTVHSLRHLMKDRLRFAGVPEGVQDSILGHSSGRVAEAYGGPEARLRLMRVGLLKALEVAL
jgi:integrase